MPRIYGAVYAKPTVRSLSGFYLAVKHGNIEGPVHVDPVAKLDFELVDNACSCARFRPRYKHAIGSLSQANFRIVFVYAE